MLESIEPNESIEQLSPAPLLVISEQVDNALSFNVMPERSVTETLHIKEYRVGDKYAEARFDRSYHSAMLKSPSHLIFLSAVAHLQKILYVYVCHRLKLDYDPRGPEKLKLWPTKIDVRMAKMIRDERELVHRVYIDEFSEQRAKQYRVRVHSDVNNILFIDGESPVYIL